MYVYEWAFINVGTQHCKNVLDVIPTAAQGWCLLQQANYVYVDSKKFCLHVQYMDWLLQFQSVGFFFNNSSFLWTLCVVFYCCCWSLFIPAYKMPYDATGWASAVNSKFHYTHHDHLFWYLYFFYSWPHLILFTP